MENKEFNHFKVNIDYSKDEFEDVVSSTSSEKKQEFEDIYSSVKKPTKKQYAKKKHQKAGWWKRRKKWQKTVVALVLCIFVLLGVIATLLVSMFNYNYNNITDEPTDLGFEDIIDKKIVNVALFGIDTRDPNVFTGNSDSIMILSLNTETKKVKIISVMRDSFVPIVEDGYTKYNKINSAYAWGGPELAIRTLNQVFDLDISEYATVNFYGMVDIIDAVGGIEAELTSAEVRRSDGTLRQINGCIDEICENLGVNPKEHYITTAGKHHLNGIQAVAYSRIRYVANIWGTTDDYGRTDRQRHVMEQLFNKALTIGKSQYMKLAKSLIPCSETSLSYSEIISLAFSILLDSPTFEQTRMPQKEFLMTAPQTSAGSVVYYDIDFAKKLVHAFIYDDITPENYIAENGVEKNNWYAQVR